MSGMAIDAGAAGEDLSTRIGRSIRVLRRQQGLTLVQLATKAELSHPFLSQLERGLARPSMASLHRLAQALGTTQPALMSMAADDGAALSADGRVSLVTAGSGVPVDNPGGVARSLVAGARAIYPVLFDGAPAEFGQAYTHPGDEFVHVIAGTIEVEVQGEGLFVVGPGDTLYYPGVLPHRWRQLAGPTSRILLVQDARAH
ncbi:helix-turn-helix domain protein [Pseudofrankia inefficax]|uniref:Helix-turn-helix domain protein n=2 Tax=Pseudofrankia inefficax (strain DSM 45817 / CECT 9037 / DDB 130130 / EuI1c) TaxID=298654 RepID=E3J319_PSEI1|nr:helix-turn-helix domain protein [Pseudofrankia inefficax]